MLEGVFAQLKVSLWGIASLDGIVQGAHEYKCIVFCIPYDNAAVEALPDDELISRCRSALGEKARAVYEAIAEASAIPNMTTLVPFVCHFGHLGAQFLGCDLLQVAS